VLTGIDRILITVSDRRRAAEDWCRLLGAVAVREDVVEALGAERSVLRLGASEIELLEPAGLGTTAEHLSRNRGGLFAVGLATPDLAVLRARLDAQGVHYLTANDQLFAASDWLGIAGLRVVLSQHIEREPNGLLSHFYEVTHLSHDFRAAAQRFAELFSLDPARFAPIRSDEYGYQGTLTLFHPDRLDRIETVTPFDHGKTMGRYFARRGPRFYMAYAESENTTLVRERLLEHAPKHWSGARGQEPPDNLFIHPPALGGVMIGVSRTSYAWTWSGRPDRVSPPSAA
jgi:catechol 2,3-dioxygenase-like lactoylglutathione lyase family enzyme